MRFKQNCHYHLNRWWYNRRIIYCVTVFIICGKQKVCLDEQMGVATRPTRTPPNRLWPEKFYPFFRWHFLVCHCRLLRLDRVFSIIFDRFVSWSRAIWSGDFTKRCFTKWYDWFITHKTNKIDNIETKADFWDSQ